MGGYLSAVVERLAEERRIKGGGWLFKMLRDDCDYKACVHSVYASVESVARGTGAQGCRGDAREIV